MTDELRVMQQIAPPGRVLNPGQVDLAEYGAHRYGMGLSPAGSWMMRTVPLSLGSMLMAPIIDRSLLDMFLRLGGKTPSGGRQPLKLDREAIIASIRDHWQNWLLTQPGNPGDLADQYITAASAFHNQGGSSVLDLQTWVENKMRQTARYKTLYRNKPAGQAEADYLGGYRNTAASVGMRPTFTIEETARAAEAGIDLASFVSQLTGSQEYMTVNQGNFSRSFGQMMAGLGPLNRE